MLLLLLLLFFFLVHPAGILIVALFVFSFVSCFIPWFSLQEYP